MQIWTTIDMTQFLPKATVHVKLKIVPSEEIKPQFLKEAQPNDIAVLKYEEDHMDYVSALRAKGNICPVLFVAIDAPVTFVAEMQDAIVLDSHKLGSDEIREIVQFMCRMAENLLVEIKGKGKAPAVKMPDERPLEDISGIKDLIKLCMAKKNPLVVAVQMERFKESFTARGICTIKELTEDTMVLSTFRPEGLIAGIEGQSKLFVIFPLKNKSFETILDLKKIEGGDVHASIPTKMVLERRRAMRIEPASMKPVTLGMLREGRPTLSLKLADISQRGVGFFLDEDIPKDSEHTFSIFPPAPHEVVISQGIVRFKQKIKGVLRYGIELLVHPDDEKKLSNYVLEREKEVQSLLREIKK